MKKKINGGKTKEQRRTKQKVTIKEAFTQE